jgi:hypothetical protein
MSPSDRLASPGLRVVLDLEIGLTIEDLIEGVRAYAIASDYDGSLIILKQRTGATIDLRSADHRAGVLTWLRQWGCRHLNLASDAVASSALLAWADAELSKIPDLDSTLTTLPPDDVTRLAVAYGHLSDSVAGLRRLPTGDRSVTFGPTAAAKTLYAIRPNSCAPWDDPIRLALGLGRNDAAYRRYLQLVSRALSTLSERAGVEIADLPAHVGRPASSPPKLIDEYLWMKITRGSAGPNATN